MKLSLCCISNMLAEKDIKFRTMTYKSFSSKSKIESLEKLSDIVRNNFNTTEKIIRHCSAVGIKGYRISSGLKGSSNQNIIYFSDKVKDLEYDQEIEIGDGFLTGFPLIDKEYLKKMGIRLL